MEQTSPAEITEKLTYTQDEKVVAGIRCGYLQPVSLGESAQAWQRAMSTIERRVKNLLRQVLVADSTSPTRTRVDTSFITPEVWGAMSQIEGAIAFPGLSTSTSKLFFLRPSDSLISALPDTFQHKQRLSNMALAYDRVAEVPKTLAELQGKISECDAKLRTSIPYYGQLRDVGGSLQEAVGIMSISLPTSNHPDVERLSNLMNQADMLVNGFSERVQNLNTWNPSQIWSEACEEILNSRAHGMQEVKNSLKNEIINVQKPPQQEKVIKSRERPVYDEIPPLKKEDIKTEDPLIILARLVNDVVLGRFDTSLVTLIQERFGGVVSTQGTLENLAISQVIHNIQTYWVDGPPISVDTKDIGDVDALPIAEADVEEIKQRIPAARESIVALARRDPLRSARKDPAIQLRLTYSQEELLAISRLLREDPRNFRMFEANRVLSRDQTFDALARSYLSLPLDQRRVLLDMYRNPGNHGIFDINDSVDTLMHYCPEAMRPSPFNQPIHGGDMHMTTIFDIGERTFARSRTYEPEQLDESSLTGHIHRLKNISNALMSLEPTFNNFFNVFQQSLKQSNNNYVQALCMTRNTIEQSNPGAWARMKRVAQATLFLQDIGHAQYRNEQSHNDTTGESGVKLRSALPEPLANPWLRISPTARRRKNVTEPRPYGSPEQPAYLHTEPGVTYVYTGVNGSGKTVREKTAASPLPTICGRVESGMFVPDLNGGVTVSGDRPRFYGESAPVVPPNASQFQAQARLMLIALTDGANLDEITGTTPEWKLALAVAARLMGLSRLVSHSPLEEAGCLRAILGEQEYRIKVDGQMVHAGETTLGRVVTLSGGAYLAGAVGCRPEYLDLITQTAREHNIPLFFPPEYQYISKFLQEVEQREGQNTLEGPFSPDSIKYLGFGPSGEIPTAGAQLIAEAIQGTALNGLEFAITNAVDEHTARLMENWLRDPNGVQTRSDLIDFFLAKQPQSKVKELFARARGEQERSACSAHAYPLLACMVPGYIRDHPPVALELLRKVTQKGTAVVLGDFPTQLAAMKFFSDSTRAVLRQIPQFYTDLSAHPSKEVTTVVEHDNKGESKFKENVQALILNIIDENIDTLVGLHSGDRSNAESLSRLTQECDTLKNQLYQEEARQDAIFREKVSNAANGFLAGIPDEKKASLLRSISAATQTEVTEDAVVNALKDTILCHEIGHTEDNIWERHPILAACYLIISQRAENTQLTSALGDEYLSPDGGGFKGRIDWNCSQALRRGGIVGKVRDQAKSSALTQQEAANLTMRLLAIIAESLRGDEHVVNSGTSNLLFMHRNFVPSTAADFIHTLPQRSSSSNELQNLRSRIAENSTEIHNIKAELPADVHDKISRADQIRVSCQQRDFTQAHSLYTGISPMVESKVNTTIQRLVRIQNARDPVAAFLRDIPFGTQQRQSRSLTIGACVGLLDNPEIRLDRSDRILLESLVTQSLDQLRSQVFTNINPSDWDTASTELEEAAVLLGLSSLLELGGQVCAYTERDDSSGISVSDGVNLQVLARMSESEAQKNAGLRKPVAQGIREASQRYRPSSVATERGVHIISAPHGGGKTTLLNKLAFSILFGKTLGKSPCKSISVPHYDRVLMLPYEGSGPDASAHTRFLMDLRDVLNQIYGSRRILLLADEVGEGTSPGDQSVETVAFLRLLARSNVDVVLISQAPSTVHQAQKDPVIQAQILGMTPNSSGRKGEMLVPVDAFVDPNVPQTLRDMGWPNEAVVLVEAIYDAIRTSGGSTGLQEPQRN